MYFWALQHGPYVELIKPVDLRERIKNTLRYTSVKYEDRKE